MVSKYYHFNHCLTEQVDSSYNASDWHSRGARLESSTVLCFLVDFAGFRTLLCWCLKLFPYHCVLHSVKFIILLLSYNPTLYSRSY